jgi:hypothetical protein
VYKFKKLLLYFNKSYALDYRALALMRISLALVIIVDLFIRTGDLEAHYCNTGIWPTELIHNFGWQTGFWSVHALSGNYAWVFFLMAAHLVFAVFLLFGYKTKWATALVWLLYISLHNRNVFILQAGDDLLRLVLFWGLFLPWHSRYSIDARRNNLALKQSTLANLGYLLLIASVYFFSVSLKTSHEWHANGTAVYYALSLDQLRLPFLGDYVYQFPTFMKLLTWFVFYVELLIPVLILYPAKKGYLRSIAFALIVLLHIGIGLTVYVGLFYLISIVSAIGLLPSSFMNRVESTFRLKKIERNGRIKKNSDLLFIKTTVCIIVIILCLIINLSSVSWFSYQLRKAVLTPINTLRLNQYWGMFSPSVIKKDGWFVYYGIDSLGRQWDLRLNQDYVDFKKPKHVVGIYKSDRWRKLAENMQGNHTFLRPLYGKYILRQWNKQHPEKKIVTLNVYFMEKETLPNYKTSPLVKHLFCVCVES